MCENSACKLMMHFARWRKCAQNLGNSCADEQLIKLLLKYEQLSKKERAEREEADRVQQEIDITMKHVRLSKVKLLKLQESIEEHEKIKLEAEGECKRVQKKLRTVEELLKQKKVIAAKNDTKNRCEKPVSARNSETASEYKSEAISKINFSNASMASTNRRSVDSNMVENSSQHSNVSCQTDGSIQSLNKQNQAGVAHCFQRKKILYKKRCDQCQKRFSFGSVAMYCNICAFHCHAKCLLQLKARCFKKDTPRVDGASFEERAKKKEKVQKYALIAKKK